MVGLLDLMPEGDRNAQLNDAVAYGGLLDRQVKRKAAWDEFKTAAGDSFIGGLLKSAIGAAALPGDVYAGRVDPTSEVGIQRAADLAGVVTTGAMPFAQRGALGSGGGKIVQPAIEAPLTQPPAAPARPSLLGNPELQGSMNPLDEVPFTYRGKAPAEWTPDEFAEVGRQFGVSNLGPATPGQVFKYADGAGEFSVPGGLDGTFTYYDMLALKAQGIDPSRIDRGLHTQLQQKILRTMTPQDLSDEQVWSGLVFGMTSPNNPLFPNQLAQSRLRMREPQMLDDLAGMISWKPGEAVDPAVRKEAGDRIANAFGLDAASKGGLGVRGSTDYTRVAELAQMFKQDPSFFRKSANEGWDQFVERVSSQVAGLSMKTGSFGSVWQDPATAAISAIDRHMANQFEKTGGLFKDEAQRMGWEKRVVDRWNKGNPDRPVDTFFQLRQTPGTDGHIGGMLLEYVGDAKTPKFRLAPKRGSGAEIGEINPAIPQHLQEAKWVSEPQTVFKMGEAYKRALDINDQIAREHGLGLFGSQWMEWDRIRRRLEPHENMFPGLERIPAMSRDQLRAVDMEHRLSGHKNYTKVDAQGRKLKDVPEDELAAMEGVFLQPTKARPDPSRFGYFSVVPAIPFAGGLLGTEGDR